MKLQLFIHIAGGTLALASGYLALYSKKGGSLHRRSGRAFVYAMLAMTGFGGLIAATQANHWSVVNVSAATLSAYLVISSLTTVRPLARGGHILHYLGMITILLLAVIDLLFATLAIGGGGALDGVPAFPYVMFGVVALVAGTGDLRALPSGRLEGRRRIVRHLWRMTFALFIAAMSFFIGQAKVIPEPIRIFPLLAVPVLAVLLTLIYWLWRMRKRRDAVDAVAQLERA